MVNRESAAEEGGREVILLPERKLYSDSVEAFLCGQSSWSMKTLSSVETAVETKGLT